MKVRYVWAILLALSFYSCDDNTGSLGLDMFPKDDDVIITHKTYDAISRSVPSGPIFAKSDTVYVGKYKDSNFGNYEASFLTQLNCVDSLTFPQPYKEVKDSEGNMIPTKDSGIMAGDTTHLTELILEYTTFLGDTISPNTLSVYKLNKSLKTDHYTDINADEFYREDDLLATATYSGMNLNKGTNNRRIRLLLDKSIGEDILIKNRENPSYFYTNKDFVENVFKGVYAKNTMGGGSILFVNSIYLNVVYTAHYVDSLGVKLLKEDETDSLYQAYRTFSATREIVQANKLQSNTDAITEKINETGHTYIKSPSGIFTEVDLELEKLLDDENFLNDTINNVKMVFQAYINEDQGDSSFPLNRPKYLGLFKKSVYEKFFEQNEVFDYVTSYFTYINSNNQYSFNSLEKLIMDFKSEISNAEKEAKEKAGSSWDQATWRSKWLEDNKDWGKVLLVPVLMDVDEKGQVKSVSHNLRPEAVKLVGGKTDTDGEAIKLEILYSHMDEMNSNLAN